MRSVDDDFREAKLGGYVGSILFGGFGAVFVALLGVAIGLSVEEARAGALPVAGMIASAGLALCAAAFGLLALWSLRRLQAWKRLDASPIGAWGTIRQVRRSPTKINTRHLYTFSLAVRPADSPPYEAESKWFLPPDLEPVITPGTQVALRVDPVDRQNVVIDWECSRAVWDARPGSSGARAERCGLPHARGADVR